MPITDEFAEVRARWRRLSLYQRFEHAVILIFSALIAVLVVLAVWNLVLKIFVSIVFGMIFTVIIALEFERSLLVIAERDRGACRFAQSSSSRCSRSCES
jgi:hypothetical protein